MLIREKGWAGTKQGILLPGCQRVLMFQLKDPKRKGKKIILIPTTVFDDEVDKVVFGLVKSTEMITEILSLLKKGTIPFGRYIEDENVYHVEKISVTDDELSWLWPILTFGVLDEQLFLGNQHSNKVFSLKRQGEGFIIGREQWLNDIEVSCLAKLILSGASFL